MWLIRGMIVLVVLSALRHHETNGVSVLQNVYSSEAIVVKVSSLKPWLSRFCGRLSRRVIASLF